MTEQRLKELHEDRAEMVQILQRNGLLMEMSDAALNRNIGVKKKNRVKLFAGQIRKASRIQSYTTRAETAVKYIRRMGALPDGRLTAMHLLIDIADAYCSENGEWNFTSDTYCSGERVIRLMDELMANLIRGQYQAIQASKDHWNTCSLQEKMEEAIEERIPADVDLGSCDPRDREKLFPKSLPLLQLVGQCRFASILADKVVGHRLPEELVVMVQLYICSDEPLRIVDKAADDSK